LPWHPKPDTIYLIVGYRSEKGAHNESSLITSLWAIVHNCIYEFFVPGILIIIGFFIALLPEWQRLS